MMLARLTVDLLRPVPMTPLEVRTSVRREGKRLQVVDVSMLADGVEVVAATALRMRIGDLAGLELPGGKRRVGPPAVPLHEHSRLPSIAVEAMTGTLEYALEPGDDLFDDPYWARLCVPIVEGELLTPIERMAFIADTCSGVGHARTQPVTGINADLMLRVVRPSVGEWLRVDGAGFTSQFGIGLSQVTLSDEFGVVGAVSMSRLVDHV